MVDAIAEIDFLLENNNLNTFFFNTTGVVHIFQKKHSESLMNFIKRFFVFLLLFLCFN
jgi:hypothetical protein